MKKLFLVSSFVSYLLSPAVALAQETVRISPPPRSFKDLSSFINNLLTLVFVMALIIVLIMLVWGAFEWITSGGDKDHVASARNRIINALIGLAVLAVAFALAKAFGQFVGLDITNLTIPSPP